MVTLPDWSEIEVALVQRVSRMITCKNLQPLKILNPRSPAHSCQVILSNYGGGLVSGDTIRLKIRCGPGASLFLGTQANTKIFKSIDGAEAAQVTEGVVERAGLAVVFPDPVVPQEHSRFRQIQHWDLKSNGLLLLVDWFYSGRMDTGEMYRFTSYFSELRVTREGTITLSDRFAFRPDTHIPDSPANFGPFQTMLSTYLVGDPADDRFKLLAAFLEQQLPPKTGSLNPDLLRSDCLVSVVPAKEGVYVLRASARSRLALQPLCEALASLLAAPSLLGFNPLKRKF